MTESAPTVQIRMNPMPKTHLSFEPTPETDAACMAECWPDVVLPTGYAPASFARDLERRLRAAERLLSQAAPWVPAECVLRAAIDAHMLAANTSLQGAGHLVDRTLQGVVG